MEFIEKIEVAFDKVSPGLIGIREARAMDDRIIPGGLYEDLLKYKEACRLDKIETHWLQIPDEVLALPPVFPFFDDNGFKFILPAIMHWSTRNNFKKEKDPCNVAEYLVYKLLPESRKADKPNKLILNWNLSGEQIVVIIDWITMFVDQTKYTLTNLESEQLECWKLLLETKGY